MLEFGILRAWGGVCRPGLLLRKGLSVQGACTENPLLYMELDIGAGKSVPITQ